MSCELARRPERNPHLILVFLPQLRAAPLSLAAEQSPTHSACPAPEAAFWVGEGSLPRLVSSRIFVPPQWVQAEPEVLLCSCVCANSPLTSERVFRKRAQTLEAGPLGALGQQCPTWAERCSPHSPLSFLVGRVGAAGGELIRIAGLVHLLPSAPSGQLHTHQVTFHVL